MEQTCTIKKEFVINDKIGLRLISNDKDRDKTVIVINGQEISQCMYLLMDFDEQQAIESNEYVNIDELGDKYSKGLERNISSYSITPEEEFWGHCSNIQAWVENDYNPCCLHSSLSVPLLNLLAKTDIKVFHMLLYHLDDMWLQYKTVERKTFVLDKYRGIVTKCIQQYDMKYEDCINSIFIKAMMIVKVAYEYGNILHRIYVAIGQYYKQMALKVERELKERKEREYLNFIKKRSYWERKIWGSSKGNPEILRYRKWLRDLRDCRVSVVSDEMDYPAYIWSKYSHRTGYKGWKSVEECVNRHTYGHRKLFEAYKTEGMTHFYGLNYEFTFSNGWNGSYTLFKVLARYEDGHFEVRHIVW